MLSDDLKGLVLPLISMIVLDIKNNNNNKETWDKQLQALLQSLPFIEVWIDEFCLSYIISYSFLLNLVTILSSL